jgi:hypothetical protein
MPRKIRYARPVVCQGEQQGNWPPARPASPFHKAFTDWLLRPWRLGFHLNAQHFPPLGAQETSPGFRREMLEGEPPLPARYISRHFG